MRKYLVASLALVLTSSAALAQLTLPSPGDNQKSSVIQNIGLVTVRVDYNSPDVHAPSGEDRRGKIWGKLVPYGFYNDDFGTCTECPWRVGANENTVFTVSHPVRINGQNLPAGSYGLHMVADPNEWTVIFSKNHTSWGSYFYDPAEDALRVKAKPEKAEYNEWLTFEFTDRRPDRATVAMKWEELAVPFTIEVPNSADLYIAQLGRELRSQPGFTPDNWVRAARYALGAKRLDTALAWAQTAVNAPFMGREDFNSLSVLADVQEAKKMTAEARATRDRALMHATATPLQLHAYARTQFQKGNKAEAARVWRMNARRFGKQWPVNVGLARAASAEGRYKEALEHARAALAQAPDEPNRKSLQEAIAKLEAGKDMN